MLQRLKDGKSVEIAEARVLPNSACLSPDGQKLAYTTQPLAAVQIDLAQAYERFRYWDDLRPKTMCSFRRPKATNRRVAVMATPSPPSQSAIPPSCKTPQTADRPSIATQPDPSATL